MSSSNRFALSLNRLLNAKSANSMRLCKADEADMCKNQSHKPVVKIQLAMYEFSYEKRYKFSHPLNTEWWNSQILHLLIIVFQFSKYITNIWNVILNIFCSITADGFPTPNMGIRTG